MVRLNILIFFSFFMFSSLCNANEELTPEHKLLQEKVYSLAHCIFMIGIESMHSVKLEFEVDSTFYSAENTERRLNKIIRLNLNEIDRYAEQFFENPRKSEYALVKWREPSNVSSTWAGKNGRRLIMAGIKGDFKEIDMRIKKCVEVYELDAPENDLPFDFDSAEIIKPPFE